VIETAPGLANRAATSPERSEGVKAKHYFGSYLPIDRQERLLPIPILTPNQGIF